jgi:predicted permease
MRANPSAALKEGARGSSAGGGGLRRVLVVSEVAIALVVAVGASLLARSFAQLSAVDPGFETGRVLAMDLSGLPAPAERAAFMEQLYERVQAVPGVVAAGEVSRVPLAGRTNITSMMDVEGRPLPQNEQPEVDFRRASRGYFPAMGIDLKEGRLFESTDDASADPVALVNEVVAERHFGGKAIGQRVSLGGGTFFRIVGVTGAIRHVNLTEEPRPEVYIHTLQGALSNPQLLVRTAGDPAAIATAIRNAIRAAGSQVVISDMTTMDEIRRVSLERPRFNTLLFSLFAMLALVLSTIGVWGVMAYSVSQRAREFGVRISLGARPHDVGMMVVRDGLKLALAGIGLGVAAAFAGTRLMAGMLFGVSATDLPTYAVAAGILCTAVLLAAIASARRATRVDPVRALQAE